MKFLFVFLSLAFSCGAFNVQLPQGPLSNLLQQRKYKNDVSLSMTADTEKNDDGEVSELSRRGLVRFFGAFTAASVFAMNHPAKVSAQQMPITPLGMSSIELAEAVKTLDMSLPTYGDIKSSKASAANVASLTVPASKGGGVSGAAFASKRKKSKESSDGGGPSLLPSMNKQSAEAKKKAEKEPKYEF